MPALPYLDTDDDPGIYQVITTGNTDYVLTAPNDATGLVIWFETSASVTTMIGGRIGVSESDTAVTSIGNTDAKLGYHPAMPVEYDLRKGKQVGGVYAPPYTYERYVHVTTPVSLSVARGYWLTRYE